MKKVIVKVNKDGSKTEIKVEGVIGTSCQDVTAAIQKALGNTEKTTETDEYYQQDTETVKEST